MIRRLLIVLLVAVLGLLGYAALQPDRFRVERSTVIAAPPAAVYAQIDDFNAWARWSPWEKRDPAMQRTLGGAARGVGATYAWKGNDQVGAGRMTITEAAPAQRLVIRLEFLEPFAATNTAEFALQPQADGTKVTWAMHGPSPFLSKLMQVFVSMDAMVGKDFETGLANLKSVVASGAGVAR